MKATASWTERRKHARYYPDRESTPKVNFAINGDEKFSVDVINISRGGLLGYTIDYDLTNNNHHQHIREIEIAFPGRAPFYCSGKLLRVSPSRMSLKCFCAVQFEPIGFDRHHNQLDVGDQIEASLRPSKIIVIPDQMLINRLQQCPNFMKISDQILADSVRKAVYDSFDDIISYLSLEEKWYFLQMIDELKRHEPDYPEDLKKAFITISRIGLELAQRKGNSVEPIVMK